MLDSGQNIKSLYKNLNFKKKNIAFAISDPGGIDYVKAYINYLDKNFDVFFHILISKNIQNFYKEKKNQKNLSIHSITDNKKKDLMIKFLKKLDIHHFFLTQSYRSKSLVNIYAKNLYQFKFKNIFIIQDYWGVMSILKTNIHQNYHYLVIDINAKKILSNLGVDKKKIIISAIQKKIIQKFKINKNCNKKFKIGKKKTIVFFSQPLSFGGIKENLIVFSTLYKKYFKNYTFFIKPHPLDNDLSFYTKLFLKYKIKILNQSYSNNILFNNSDIIINSFSSVGYEHTIAQGSINKNLGLLIYLRLGEKIKKTLKKLNDNNQGMVLKSLPGIIAKKKMHLAKILDNEDYQKKLITRYSYNSKKYLDNINKSNKMFLSKFNNLIKQ